jgi:hypothetical protein
MFEKCATVLFKTREAENGSVGVCVDDDSDKCPSPNATTLSMTNCRPGTIGILVKSSC